MARQLTISIVGDADRFTRATVQAIAAAANMSGAVATMNTTTAATTTATEAAGVSSLGMSAGMLAIVGAAVAATVALAPFLAIIVAWAAVTAPFLAGVAAIAALLALVTPLAIQTGLLTEPMALLSKTFDDWARILGDAAVPMVKQMIDELVHLIPWIAKMGLEAMHWLGPQMAGILSALDQALGVAGNAAMALFGWFTDRAPRTFPDRQGRVRGHRRGHPVCGSGNGALRRLEYCQLAGPLAASCAMDRSVQRRQTGLH